MIFSNQEPKTIHLYRYLVLYSPKYTNLRADVSIACIVLCRICILPLQRASLKDVDQARLVVRVVLQLYWNRERIFLISI